MVKFIDFWAEKGQFGLGGSKMVNFWPIWGRKWQFWGGSWGGSNWGGAGRAKKVKIKQKWGYPQEITKNVTFWPQGAIGELN